MPMSVADRLIHTTVRIAAALATGRQRKCPVVVAKLDRLSREGRG